MTTRWFALRSLYEPGAVAPEVAPAPVVTRPPVLAVFSLAGGVGKTSLVATVGRALAAVGERMLLVDTASFGLLPFFFGARDQRPGVLRTFSPGGNSSDAPVQLITIDPEGLGAEAPGQELLATEIARHWRSANRVIIDLATASGATTRRIMRLQPLVLVPVVPDMNSVVSVSSIDAFFLHNSSQPGKPIQPFYILNQFDSSLPLNLDVREVLRAQLGERLLPFVLRRAAAMSEALAEGMTVMDYAPNSGLAEDFNQLAGWVKSQSSPASTTYRGVRWSAHDPSGHLARYRGRRDIIHKDDPVPGADRRSGGLWLSCRSSIDMAAAGGLRAADTDHDVGDGKELGLLSDHAGADDHVGILHVPLRVLESFSDVAFLSGSGKPLGRAGCVFILCLLIAELYAFAILFLGYFQTIWPLGVHRWRCRTRPKSGRMWTC